MASQNFLFDGKHFIVLDLLNTISDNCTTINCPSIQIVDESDEIRFQDIEKIKNRIENALKIEEKKEILFTITLNIDDDYKIQLFR